MSANVPTGPLTLPIYANRPIPSPPLPRCGFRGQLSDSVATLYTAPNEDVSPIEKAKLYSITLCNTDSSARTVTLYLVEDGGTADATRTICSAKSIAANTEVILEWNRGLTLEQGETLQGLADSASKVTVRVEVEEMR